MKSRPNTGISKNALYVFYSNQTYGILQVNVWSDKTAKQLANMPKNNLKTIKKL